MPSIITDTFDSDDIIRVLDLDDAFVHHKIDELQPKYWRMLIKTKPKGLKVFRFFLDLLMHYKYKL